MDSCKTGICMSAELMITAWKIAEVKHNTVYRTCFGIEMHIGMALQNCCPDVRKSGGKEPFIGGIYGSLLNVKGQNPATAACKLT